MSNEEDDAEVSQSQHGGKCETCGYEADNWEDARQHYLNSLKHEAAAQRKYESVISKLLRWLN